MFHNSVEFYKATVNKNGGTIFERNISNDVVKEMIEKILFEVFLYHGFVFLFLVLLELLVFSVVTRTISLFSKLCRSLLISWSFSFVSGISVSHPIDRSYLSTWVRFFSNWSEPFI